MNWKRFFEWNVGVWGIVGGIVALLAYLGVFPQMSSGEYKEIDHVVIKSTAGENDHVGQSLRSFLESKGLKVTGPELPRSEQKKELDNVLKVFHKKDWIEAEKLQSSIKVKTKYKLGIRPLYDLGNSVPKGEVQIWLAQ